MSSIRVRSLEGDTVDLIAWRELGFTAGATEAILDANPGLAALGPVLPTGTPVVLPVPQAETPRQEVRLWD